MVRSLVGPVIWSAIVPLERVTFWKAGVLVLAGLAASVALRLAFVQWLQGQTLFVAFLPAILLVTLRGGLIAGAATLLLSKSFALSGVVGAADSLPRVLLWGIVGGIVVLTAHVVRERIRTERAQREALLARQDHTMKVLYAFETSARQAASTQAENSEAARLAWTLQMLRLEIESPGQLDAFAKLAV